MGSPQRLRRKINIDRRREKSSKQIETGRNHKAASSKMQSRETWLPEEALRNNKEEQHSAETQKIHYVGVQPSTIWKAQEIENRINVWPEKYAS